MSAIATLNHNSRELLISAKLYFYGNESSDDLARRIVQEINEMYNQPNVATERDKQHYQVRFEVKYELVYGDALVQLAIHNQDFTANFIRLEKQNYTTRSFMGFGLGDNAGHWITSDNLGTSTTAAHEFGHGLGLDHPPYTDLRDLLTAPPIMAPRGTWVQPPYQWSPEVAAGEYGGTLNPSHRKVSAAEVSEVVENLAFSSSGVAFIGKLSNTLFDEMGNPLRWLA